MLIVPSLKIAPPPFGKVDAVFVLPKKVELEMLTLEPLCAYKAPPFALPEFPCDSVILLRLKLPPVTLKIRKLLAPSTVINPPPSMVRFVLISGSEEPKVIVPETLNEIVSDPAPVAQPLYAAFVLAAVMASRSEHVPLATFSS